MIEINGSTGYNSISPNSTFRNYLINGNFNFWQRGTSGNANSGGAYVADRWICAGTGTAISQNQQSFVIGQSYVPNNPTYFIRNSVMSVNGSGNYALMAQRIEDVTKLSGKTVTLSFWAKADSTKNVAIDVSQFFGTGGSPSALVNTAAAKIVITSTWAKYTTTFTVPSVSGKTLGTTDNSYTAIRIWFDAGTDWNSTSNSLGQQSGIFDIAQVQLEDGSFASNYELRYPVLELEMCQRYYQINYFYYCASCATTTPTFYQAVYRPVHMRAIPVDTITSSTVTNCTLSVLSSTPRVCHMQLIPTATGTFRTNAITYLTADAEL